MNASPKPPPVLRTARKIAVAVVGSSVLLIGLALVVLPGPAFLVIPAGLAILATEFVWARRLLKTARQGVLSLTLRASRRRPQAAPERVP